MIAKTEEDIVILREGGRRLANHLQYLLKMLKPGLLVRALEEVALERVKKEADIPAFLGYRPGKMTNPILRHSASQLMIV